MRLPAILNLPAPAVPIGPVVLPDRWLYCAVSCVRPGSTPVAVVAESILRATVKVQIRQRRIRSEQVPKQWCKCLDTRTGAIWSKNLQDRRPDKAPCISRIGFVRTAGSTAPLIEPQRQTSPAVSNQTSKPHTRHQKVPLLRGLAGSNGPETSFHVRIIPQNIGLYLSDAIVGAVRVHRRFLPA